jgi:hypothetical protein
MWHIIGSIYWILRFICFLANKSNNLIQKIMLKQRTNVCFFAKEFLLQYNSVCLALIMDKLMEMTKCFEEHVWGACIGVVPLNFWSSTWMLCSLETDIICLEAFRIVSIEPKLFPKLICLKFPIFWNICEMFPVMF